MKLSLIILSALSQLSSVAAFPAVQEQLEKRQTFPTPDTGFNAKFQHIETTGKHKFIPPNFEAGDVRGPCPGLNALANHGYLPHNGVANHVQFTLACFDVYGVAPELGAFLSVLGAVLDGNGLEWSIGGPSKNIPNLGGLLGNPQGLSGSHNKYETDASPLDGDLYTSGNVYEVQMDQFEELYRMGQANGDRYDLTLLNDFRSKRFDDAVANNPYLFMGAFTGQVIGPAAYAFIYRLFANKTKEDHEGYLDSEILMSFYGITKGKNGKFTKKFGYERIPDNWFKRAFGDAYNIGFLNGDTVLAAARYPKFLTIGGNMGKPNTLTGVSPSNLTGGVMNTEDLKKGNNLMCFGMAFAAQAAPDMIKCSGVLQDVEGAMGKLNAQLAKTMKGLNCPKIDKIDTKQLSKFPGSSKLKCKNGQY